MVAFPESDKPTGGDGVSRRSGFSVRGHGYALLFLRNGYSVLVPNGRGHGDSQGYVTYGVLEAHDTVRWLEWLKGQGVNAAFGFGESLGGSVLIESLAQGADFRALVAECPYSSFEAVAEERVAQHVPSAVAVVLVKEGVLYTRLRYGVELGDARPDVAIRCARVPILLIHGLADDETLPKNSERLLRANPRAVQLWLVPAAKHTGRTQQRLDSSSVECCSGLRRLRGARTKLCLRKGGDDCAGGYWPPCGVVFSSGKSAPLALVAFTDAATSIFATGILRVGWLLKSQKVWSITA